MPGGLEPLLAQEAANLGATAVREQNGGVACTADWSVAYRTCSCWLPGQPHSVSSRLTSEAADPAKLYNGSQAD